MAIFSPRTHREGVSHAQLGHGHRAFGAVLGHHGGLLRAEVQQGLQGLTGAGLGAGLEPAPQQQERGHQGRGLEVQLVRGHVHARARVGVGGHARIGHQVPQGEQVRGGHAQGHECVHGGGQVPRVHGGGPVERPRRPRDHGQREQRRHPAPVRELGARDHGHHEHGHGERRRNPEALLEVVHPALRRSGFERRIAVLVLGRSPLAAGGVLSGFLGTAGRGSRWARVRGGGRRRRTRRCVPRVRLVGGCAGDGVPALVGSLGGLRACARTGGPEGRAGAVGRGGPLGGVGAAGAGSALGCRRALLRASRDAGLVPGAVDGVHDLLVRDVLRDLHGRGLQGQVHRGVHAVDLAQLALDPAHARGARHAGDLQLQLPQGSVDLAVEGVGGCGGVTQRCTPLPSRPRRSPPGSARARW